MDQVPLSLSVSFHSVHVWKCLSLLVGVFFLVCFGFFEGVSSLSSHPKMRDLTRKSWCTLSIILVMCSEPNETLEENLLFHLKPLPRNLIIRFICCLSVGTILSTILGLMDLFLVIS